MKALYFISQMETLRSILWRVSKQSDEFPLYIRKISLVFWGHKNGTFLWRWKLCLYLYEFIIVSLLCFGDRVSFNSSTIFTFKSKSFSDISDFFFVYIRYLKLLPFIGTIFPSLALPVIDFTSFLVCTASKTNSCFSKAGNCRRAKHCTLISTSLFHPKLFARKSIPVSRHKFWMYHILRLISVPVIAALVLIAYQRLQVWRPFLSYIYIIVRVSISLSFTYQGLIGVDCYELNHLASGDGQGKQHG